MFVFETIILQAMQIRECTYRDIPLLLNVSIQSYREHYPYLWHDEGEGYIRENFNYKQLEKEMADINSVFFLLSEEKDLGILKLNIDKGINDHSADESLELERIYFIKEASGRGLGKETLDFVTEFAKQRNKKRVWLKTMDGSRAFRFYEKQGFSAIGETFLTYPNVREEYKKMIIFCKEI